MLPTGASAVSFTVGRVGAHCAPGRSAASSVRSGVGAEECRVWGAARAGLTRALLRIVLLVSHHGDVS